MIYLKAKSQILFSKFRIVFKHKYIILLIILFGIILRTRQYLFNRPLWLDEARIALNIIDRSFTGLLKPLDYNQGAPFGFLLIEKLTALSMGDSEYVLRLFPFLCGVISILIFYRLSKIMNIEKGVLIAIALFAISDPLIYYSSELKQYSSDVAIALFLYLVASKLMTEGLPIKKIFYSSITGVVAIWFSHPAVFVLAGIGFNLYLFSFIKKDWSKIRKLSVIFGVWGLGLFFCYVIFLDDLIQNRHLITYWKNSFLPFPPTSLSDLRWYPDRFFEIFEFPVGLPFKGLAAAAFFVGCYSMFQKNRESFCMLVFPLFFLAFASFLHLYPMKGRLILFAVPNFLIFIAEGVEYIATKAIQKSIEVRFALLLLLFLYPTIFAVNHLRAPYTTEDLRPILEYIAQKKDNDNIVIYLQKHMNRAFEYYRRRYNLEGVTVIEASASPLQFDRLTDELDNLRGFKRGWVIWNRKLMKVINKDDILISYLDKVGKKVEGFKGSSNSEVYLYEFSWHKDK